MTYPRSYRKWSHMICCLFQNFIYIKLFVPLQEEYKISRSHPVFFTARSLLFPHCHRNLVIYCNYPRNVVRFSSSGSKQFMSRIYFSFLASLRKKIPFRATFTSLYFGNNAQLLKANEFSDLHDIAVRNYLRGLFIYCGN